MSGEILGLGWWVAAISLLIGCWIQTALGFGMAVLAAPVMVLFTPGWVPLILTVIAWVLSVLNSLNQRPHFQWHLMRWPMLTRVPGTLAGALLLAVMDIAWLQLAVALCVLAAVVISAQGTRLEAGEKHLGWAGFVSGIMGTTTSIGGPPMALALQNGEPQAVRANLSVYFLYSCTLSLIAYAGMGLMTPAIWLIALSLIPAAFLGFYTGKRARPYVDAGRFRPLLLLLCSVAGAAALIGAFKRMVA